MRWDKSDIKTLLDAAVETLEFENEKLSLCGKILRKERSVGLINTSGDRWPYAILEEIALALQQRVARLNVPHTAFNGGQDVWVDVGNKALGIKALQSLVGSSGANTVHFGDRFTRTGNDVKARHVASTIWVENPQDTEALCQLLLRDIAKRKAREREEGKGEGKGEGEGQGGQAPEETSGRL